MQAIISDNSGATEIINICKLLFVHAKPTITATLRESDLMERNIMRHSVYTLLSGHCGLFTATSTQGH